MLHSICWNCLMWHEDSICQHSWTDSKNVTGELQIKDHTKTLLTKDVANQMIGFWWQVNLCHWCMDFTQPQGIHGPYSAYGAQWEAPIHTAGCCQSPEKSQWCEFGDHVCRSPANIWDQEKGMSLMRHTWKERRDLRSCRSSALPLTTLQMMIQCSCTSVNFLTVSLVLQTKCDASCTP